MKRLFLLLLCVVPLFSSCNTGKLEWWEVVKPSAKRMAKASGRNDNSEMERYLFEKAEQLEAKTEPMRVDPDNWGEKMHPLLMLDLIYVILLFALLIFGWIVRFADIDARWPSVVLGILTSFVAIASIVLTLLIKSTKNSTEIGPFVVILAYLITVPYVLEVDANMAGRSAGAGIIRGLYATLIPTALIIGALFRVVATYASYLYLVVMVGYLIYVLIHSILYRVGILRTLATLIYVSLITVSTLFMIYTAMPAATSVLADIILLVFAWGIISGIGTAPGGSGSVEPASEERDQEPFVENTVTLDDYTELKKIDGVWRDNLSHKWEKDEDGWHDTGYLV